ncbi:MAG: class I SAM-dependent methyltransferase [Nanoarchaeota archaeon]|nr:class I SAM-dependent methyltransferase [Nanoarchaeota archaeon]
MTERLEDRWSDDTNFRKYFNPYREIFREASADLVSRTFADHVRTEDTILEIGSGLGELVMIAPKYAAQIQQTEQSPKIVESHQRLNPDSNVKVANVYDLPFEDLSFDVAIGYAVFDTLGNLDDALKEVGRVLSPNGKFIHFLDLVASCNTIFVKYAEQGIVPFPAFTPGNDASGAFRLVQRETARSFLNSLLPQKQDLFARYIENPESCYQLLYQDKHMHILRNMAKEVERLVPDAKVLKLNDIFTRDLEESLRRNGYNIIDSGTRDGVAIVQRNGRHRERSDINLFHNDNGFDRSRNDPQLAQELGSNQVKVVSTLYTTIAQKS